MGNCSRAPGQGKSNLEIFRKGKERKVRTVIVKGLYDVHPRWDKNCRIILKGNIFPATL